MANSGLIVTALGVILGSSLLSAIFNQAAQFLKDNKASHREVAYLALRLATVFERYAENCSNVHGGIATVNSSLGASGDLYQRLPDLTALPDEKERWRDLDVNLTSKVLMFEFDIRNEQAGIGQTFEHEGDEEGYDEVQIRAALMGIRALALSAELRKAYGLPVFDPQSLWPEYLQASYDELPIERREPN